MSSLLLKTFPTSIPNLLERQTMTTKQPVGRVLLNNARLAFPALFEPKSFDGGDARFGASLLVPADHPQLAALRKAQEQVAAEKWGTKAPGILRVLDKQDKLALHDGDLKAKYDGFAGNFFVSANAKESAQPTVIDRDRSPLSARSGRPYAGCYVNASLEFWAQDHAKFGQRVNCTLRGVQFLADGDAFSASRPADADEFEAIAGGEAEDFA
jgi:hypothetical protein